MSKHLKLILVGIGSVFVDVPSARNYTRVHGSGFARDARNLRSDCANVASDLRKKAKAAPHGDK